MHWVDTTLQMLVSLECGQSIKRLLEHLVRLLKLGCKFYYILSSHVKSQHVRPSAVVLYCLAGICNQPVSYCVLLSSA